jgi:hypothetical protein
MFGEALLPASAGPGWPEPANGFRIRASLPLASRRAVVRIVVVIQATGDALDQITHGCVADAQLMAGGTVDCGPVVADLRRTVVALAILMKWLSALMSRLTKFLWSFWGTAGPSDLTLLWPAILRF